MSLTFPIAILPTWPGWTTAFDLAWRKEVSRQANGAPRLKDLGTPLWTATIKSRDDLKPSELDYWRAVLNSLDGGEQTFKAYPLGRTYPIAYPNGSWPTGGSFSGDTAMIHTIGDDGKSFRVQQLPVGYQFSVGDFISVTYLYPPRRALFQVMEAAIADGSGITGEFEVRPHIPTGVAVGDLVSVYRPYALMSIVPGTLSMPSDMIGRGAITFDAIQIPFATDQVTASVFAQPPNSQYLITIL